MDTLVWFDPPRWLFEVQRVATGEVPYRDFSWFYPPFAVLLFGWTMKVFGITFTVAQVLVDLLSLALVLLAYVLVRRLLPRFLHVPVIFCLTAVGATSLVFFNLFSFLTYVPALQTGAVGLLLLLIGLQSYLREGRFTGRAWILVILGAFIASYSKLESLLAAQATLAILAIADRYHWFAAKKTIEWLRHYTTVAAACIAPSLGAYLWMGAVAGFANMKEGLAGYGVAAAACPWWPTGIGLVIIVAALAKATVAAGVFSLTRRKWFASRFSALYSYGFVAGFAGVCLFAAYVFHARGYTLAGSRSIVERVWSVGASVVENNAAIYFRPQAEERLLPVMWTVIVVWLYLVFQLMYSRRRTTSSARITMLVLLTGPVAMSVRGWFNWHHGVTPTVPALAYVFLLLLGPYLVWRMLALAKPAPEPGREFRSLPGGVLAVLLVIYGILRLAGGYSSLFSATPYETLHSAAGDIRLTKYASDSEIYRFIMDNTSPADTILDIPYGGGMSVATQRRSHLFTTMFVDLRMPDRFLEEDLRRIEAHPPKVIIAENQPNYGAYYGVEGCACAFPRLAWMPPTSSIVAGKVFPAIRYIQQNYRVSRVVGSKLLLVLK